MPLNYIFPGTIRKEKHIIDKKHLEDIKRSLTVIY